MGWPGSRADLGDIAGVGFFVYCHTTRALPSVAAHTRTKADGKSEKTGDIIEIYVFFGKIRDYMLH